MKKRMSNEREDRVNKHPLYLNLEYESHTGIWIPDVWEKELKPERNSDPRPFSVPGLDCRVPAIVDARFPKPGCPMDVVAFFLVWSVPYI